MKNFTQVLKKEATKQKVDHQLSSKMGKRKKKFWGEKNFNNIYYFASVKKKTEKRQKVKKQKFVSKKFRVFFGSRHQARKKLVPEKSARTSK